MLKRILCAASLAIASAAVAAPFTINYGGVVSSSSGASPAPPVGTNITGQATLDDDSTAYSPHPFLPPQPTFETHLLFGAPYGGSVEVSATTLLGTRVVVDVLDNDLSFIGLSAPGDAVIINTPGAGFNAFLVLIGLPGSFSGTEVPDDSVLATFWTSARLEAQSTSIGQGQWAFVVELDSLEFGNRAVPEPMTWTLLAPALLLAGAARGRRSNAA